MLQHVKYSIEINFLFETQYVPGIVILSYIRTIGLYRVATRICACNAEVTILDCHALKE